jgi:hypothetical protein
MVSHTPKNLWLVVEVNSRWSCSLPLSQFPHIQKDYTQKLLEDRATMTIEDRLVCFAVDFHRRYHQFHLCQEQDI